MEKENLPEPYYMDPTDVVVTEKLIEAVVKMNKVLLSHKDTNG